MSDRHAATTSAARAPVAPRYRPTQRQCNSSATASLSLGIVGVLLCWLPIVGVLCALLAVLFGRRGLSRSRRNGIGTREATVGLVLGVVALAPAVVICVAVATT